MKITILGKHGSMDAKIFLGNKGYGGNARSAQVVCLLKWGQINAKNVHQGLIAVSLGRHIVVYVHQERTHCEQALLTQVIAYAFLV